MSSSVVKTCLVMLATVFALSAPCAAMASHNANSKDFTPPEKSGVYNDPNHPGVKVRVFVHNERPERAASNALACSTDNNSSSFVSGTGWKLPSNITYTLNPASTPSSVGSANLAAIVANGFNDWASAVGGKVTLTKSSTNTSVTRSVNDGKNIIAWGRTGSSLGTTYVWYYPDTGAVVDVDTIMNKKYAWRWTPSACADNRYYDAENVMTHELGHWFGLDDEYETASYQDNTMYGYASKGETKKDTLTTGDISGASAIYP
jgi:hypothetical protein